MIKIDKKKMNTLFLAVLLVVSMMSLFRAEDNLQTSIGIQSIGRVARGDCIEITANCEMGCSYINLEVRKPFSRDIIISGESMSTLDTYSWTYDFCNTTDLGTYTFELGGDDGDLYQTNRFSFEVTPDGTAGFITLVGLILFYGLLLFGVFGKNVPLTILSGMGLMLLGVIIFNSGILTYWNDLTKGISYTTIGIGALFAIWAAYEWYQDL